MVLPNEHCSVVQIDGSGVMITGRSGSGKTSLALGLLEAFSASGKSAHFICDDQALLEERDGVLIAHAPKALAGRLELRGYGIIEMAYEPSCKIVLVANLVEPDQIERMPVPKQVSVQGISIREIDVPCRHEQHSIRIIKAVLSNDAN
jgi:serine kinase of HPr protein (carbohydrate metabolism regulator)